MYDLQAALDERLATLTNKKMNPKQSGRERKNSRAQIERSLKQAGILNRNGKMIDNVTTS